MRKRTPGLAVYGLPVACLASLVLLYFRGRLLYLGHAPARIVEDAFEVMREGIYVYQQIRTAHHELIAELERRLRVQDVVIKYLTVRLDGIGNVNGIAHLLVRVEPDWPASLRWPGPRDSVGDSVPKGIARILCLRSIKL